MNIVFPSVDDYYIKTKVADGFYSNATELVRDAVRRLREQDDHQEKVLLNALEKGARAIHAGHTILYTPHLLEKVEKEARYLAATGQMPNPDVCP